MALRANNFSINTLIGNGSFVHGNMTINGSVSIDGDFHGNIETDAVAIVSGNARIRGNIEAVSAIVGGIVWGDISARDSVKLLSSSAVIGNIITRKVQIEDKAVLHGHCIALSNEEQFEQQSKVFLETQALRDKVEHA